MIRYADDGVFCFQYEKDAVEFYGELKKRLARFKFVPAMDFCNTLEF